MLDRKYLRDNYEEAEHRLKTRNPTFTLDGFKNLDNNERNIKQTIENLKVFRNNTKDREILKDISILIKDIEKELIVAEKKLKDFLLLIPNLPHPSVPLTKWS